jgi:DNA-binding protein H-NS
MNSEELAQLRLQYHDLGERIKVSEAMAKKEALQNAKDSLTAAGLTDAEIAAHFSKVRKPSGVIGTKVPSNTATAQRTPPGRAAAKHPLGSTKNVCKAAI